MYYMDEVELLIKKDLSRNSTNRSNDAIIKTNEIVQDIHGLLLDNFIPEKNMCERSTKNMDTDIIKVMHDKDIQDTIEKQGFSLYKSKVNNHENDNFMNLVSHFIKNIQQNILKNHIKLNKNKSLLIAIEHQIYLSIEIYMRCIYCDPYVEVISPKKQEVFDTRYHESDQKVTQYVEKLITPGIVQPGSIKRVFQKAEVKLEDKIYRNVLPNALQKYQ